MHNPFKKRPPDFVVGDNYLLRWYLTPKNKYFNIYLHIFRHSDDDRALHDHPWHSVSFLLHGKLREHLPAGRTRIIDSMFPVFRKATHTHRIELIGDYSKTLFITGPIIREWGFHCPKGWKHWKLFTDPKNKGQIGPGCGE